ncbi:UDP-glucose dehydrogenase family protein [Listeria grandensis]|uniref:UDP-glucose dehydrogenase family protein n=1 Tax=Listeria grandensis TaxID=1494963 RepID=UPI00164DE23A|nr:UDP-glucose/GDP-mannose dehydrogenase family protein [Listeria grandensis]MBC6316040.1 UDP-glucose/GDP-mannose dehydrogenase family protein [Listeria grandensis]
MNIVVIGTGYVGLVTGVALAEIGHQVCCVDIDAYKIEQLQKSISPIYEPGIEELMEQNINNGRLSFKTDLQRAMHECDIIYLAVGTPQKEDGSANLEYIKAAATDVAKTMTKEMIIVVKSTVPVGTNRYLQTFIQEQTPHKVSIVSNPEFLREGVAIRDVFYGDRIVLGADNKVALRTMAEVNGNFNIPIYTTALESAEMIKYASNAFLATKISFINEIANICEKTGADIREVSAGMGMDKRIGSAFLQAGIGYGGSCFPKDTAALLQIAGDVDYDFHLLKSVIWVNTMQHQKLVNRARAYYGDLKNLTFAVLGLAFKPNTDDIREAAALSIIEMLLDEGATVKTYDPVAMENAQRVLGDRVIFCNTAEEAVAQTDGAFVVTEWQEITQMDLNECVARMKQAVIFDGRLCFDTEKMLDAGIEYYAIGDGTYEKNKNYETVY